jgi:hypothetical protein
MPEKKLITVVFEYVEGASLPKAMIEALQSGSMKYKDTSIKAISLGDAISCVKTFELM